ncbi:MFS transporter [Paenarthrobacter sp. NPDC092416]|uniref:MFS transporter n=1 Tax=Paenarthrobacter sp. NPDC092416 TaxID=3364386 RepID=UPI003811DB8C
MLESNTSASKSHPPEGQAKSRSRWAVIVLTFLAVLLDGFDTASLGLAVPSLAKDWSLSPAAFAAPLIATNAGVVLGYMICGRLSVRLGLRRMLLAGVVAFALGSALTAMSAGIPFMTIARFVTGVGLGAVLPSAISLATAGRSGGKRERIAVFVTMGLSAGSLAAGLSGGKLIGDLGWQSIFWLGAILPVILLPIMWFGIKDAEAPKPSSRAGQETVQSLFRNGFGVSTVLLWSFAFLIFATFYAFSSWLPTLLTNFGLGLAMAPLGAAALGIGGIVGALLLMVFSVRFKTSRMLVVAAAVAIAFLLMIALGHPGQWQLLLLFAGVGMGLATSMVGQAAVAVSVYPASSRTSGVAWAAALGRLGSIVGPALGGVLLATGQSPQSIVLAVCIPVVLAVAVMTLLSRRLTRPAAEDAVEPVRLPG